jgi:hypothetical protein
MHDRGGVASDALAAIFRSPEETCGAVPMLQSNRTLRNKTQTGSPKREREQGLSNTARAMRS